jgi:hypothetical protein
MQTSQRNDVSPARPESARDAAEAGRTKVLKKLQAGLEADAAQLFWDLPQDRRTKGFASEITRARVEHVKSLESNPHDVAEAITGLKLDSLPGDNETLEALTGRVAKALGNLARYGSDESGDFRLGAVMVQAVRKHPSEMAAPTLKALDAFEQKYGPLLANATVKDEDDWRAFIALFPDSEYSQHLEENIAQLDRLAAISAATKRREQEACQLWDAVQIQGDNLAQLSFKIAFARKQFDPQRARRGIQNMRLHQQMLIKDGFCPARKDFVDAFGGAEFETRTAAHCRDEPPTESGVPGVGISLASECRAAFASGC